MFKFILVIFLCPVLGFNPYKKIVSRPVFGDYGEPAFLSKYIKNGDLKGARDASKVSPLLKNEESYAGFLTVNEEYDSNVYFWFFPSQRYPEHAPLVVWLQGGPGASSLFGLFSENGPFYLDKNGVLKERNYSWTKIANVIYIDNPVGTGFSFTRNEKGYVNDEAAVGQDLHSVITQFLTIFPEYLPNDLFIFGESYGGKYAPAMAYAIHKNKSNINLKGIGIGNGFTDPINMLVYDQYLKEIGLIDDNGQKKFQIMQNDIISDFKKGEFLSAGNKFNRLVNGGECLLYNETGFSSHFNYLHYKDDSQDGDLGKFLEREDVRRSLHVGNLSFIDGNEKVEDHLGEDMIKSVIPWFKVLLENYNVLVYNGQLDIVCAYPLTVNYLKKIDWSGAEEYKKAKRFKWFVNDDLAGYVKRTKGLTEVLVRNSGHMVPQDQPLWAFVLFEKFINNKNF